MNMKYLVPAFLAIGLISGAALTTDAFAWGHNGNSGSYSSSYEHNGGGSGHNGGGYGHKGGRSGYNDNGKSGYNDNGRSGSNDNRYGHNDDGRNGTHRGYNYNANDRAQYK